MWPWGWGKLARRLLCGCLSVFWVLLSELVFVAAMHSKAQKKNAWRARRREAIRNSAEAQPCILMTPRTQLPHCVPGAPKRKRQHARVYDQKMSKRRLYFRTSLFTEKFDL